jgi:hypothetical protein
MLFGGAYMANLTALSTMGKILNNESFIDVVRSFGSKVKLFRKILKEHGVDYLPNESQITNLPIGDSLLCKQISAEITLPYYEGLSAMLNNQYWLGLYWRNNQYDIHFMSATCRLYQETNVSKINIIPWKAFGIKGIKASDRLR